MVQEEILEEANHCFEEQQAVTEDENITSDANDPMDVDTISERLEASNIIDNVHATSVILEGELSSAEMRAAVGNIYENLQSTFNNF